MSTSSPYFFISYSREDAALQKRVVAGLRERGVNVWVDVENLIPGSPAWEREIERAIRSGAGTIVLLSPDANNSEWVRREISFADDNRKRIFPVLIRGEEDDSIPLRLASHQRVDLRRDFEGGLDELAGALKEHLGGTAVIRRPKPAQSDSPRFAPETMKKAILAGAITLAGLACLSGLALSASYLYGNISQPTKIATQPINTLAVLDPKVTAAATHIDTPPSKPMGKIVYTCELEGAEICLTNSDGTGWKRLTNSSQPSFNATLAPDGQSVVYVAGKGAQTEIYELKLDNGDIKQLTKLGKYITTPEISPDNKHIMFTYRSGNNNQQIWVMNRDGSESQLLFGSAGKDAHDPVWSPDSSRILFALGRGENNKLYIMDENGHDPQLVNNTIDTRGHSDWSIHDLLTLDMGGTFKHEIYVMNLDGSGLHQISQPGNNSQGESFSPDGEWIVFSAYTDVANKNTASCEIYVMRADGSEVKRLTKNNYCDYQPRWGN